MAERLHILFSPSTAASLRQAFESVGIDETVLPDFDDLSFGPIDPCDADIRQTWVEDVLCYDYDIAAETAAFWRNALSTETPRVVWTSQRVAREYAGFLEFVWRAGEAPFEVLDLTELSIAGSDGERRPAMSGLILPHQFLEGGLLEQARPLLPDERAASLALWRRLRGENASLRVIEGGELRSAPLDYFDASLLSYASDEWRSMALLVGHLLAEAVDTSIYQTGDLLPFARIRALVEIGALEAQGDITDARCKVRLPSP